MVKTLKEDAMGVYDKVKKLFSADVVKPKPKAMVNGYVGTPIYEVSFNGEKNFGEMGPPRLYTIDYEGLRMRSWQAYLESDITQTAIKRYATWTIGSGLKLQSEPPKQIFKMESIDLNVQEFCETVESRFSVYSNSKMADYSGMKTLGRIAKRAFINSIVGGDVLVILRLINNTVKVQLIDGSHVQYPFGNREWIQAATTNGNIIRDGIEIDSTGKHIAYYVKQRNLSYERIEARSNKQDLVISFMLYGLEYRLDNMRGIPLLTVVMEKMKKMERYAEAAVGSAEERQKIPFFFEHQLGASGENPMENALARLVDADNSTDDNPEDVHGNKLADRVAATMNKTVVNLYPGTTVKAVDSKNEMYYKDFFNVNFDHVCAAIGIPPNVAASKYDANFSASRAALKDWEHTIGEQRTDFSNDFYQHIYNFWLEVQILQSKVKAPGYLTAKVEKNEMVIEAYRTARFTGATVPHIDPVKEVEAERLKLGKLGDSIPLTTIEAATEALNGGDSDSNIEQFSEEYKSAKKFGLIQEIKEPPVNQ